PRCHPCPVQCPTVPKFSREFLLGFCVIFLALPVLADREIQWVVPGRKQVPARRLPAVEQATNFLPPALASFRRTLPCGRGHCFHHSRRPLPPLNRSHRTHRGYGTYGTSILEDFCRSARTFYKLLQP